MPRSTGKIFTNGGRRMRLRQQVLVTFLSRSSVDQDSSGQEEPLSQGQKTQSHASLLGR